MKTTPHYIMQGENAANLGIDNKGCCFYRNKSGTGLDLRYYVVARTPRFTEFLNGRPALTGSQHGSGSECLVPSCSRPCSREARRVFVFSMPNRQTIRQYRFIRRIRPIVK